MDRSIEERFDQVFKQIVEIAKGNFEFRYRPSARLDLIDTTGALLNMLGEEIAYFNFDSSSNIIVKPAPVVILFDQHLKLIDYSPRFLEILGHTKPVEDKASIDFYLTEYSEPLLYEELRSTSQGAAANFFPLDFNTADKRIFRSNCSLINLIKQVAPVNALLIYEDFKKENLKATAEVKNSAYTSVKTKSSTNRVFAKKLRMYCLRNLDKPLPSLREIGLEHQTNATKIKTVFKSVYGLTIHQFHLQERLKRAYIKLQTSDLPIKQIAVEYGFNSASHFTRSFKNHYGLAPLFVRQR